MTERNIIYILVAIIIALTFSILNWNKWSTSWNLTEDQLDTFFRKHTIEGNIPVAIKIQFTQPMPGIAYVATIHWYQNNKSVCEELIAPYNIDPTLTAIAWSTYYCEEIR